MHLATKAIFGGFPCPLFDKRRQKMIVQSLCERLTLTLRFQKQFSYLRYFLVVEHISSRSPVPLCWSNETGASFFSQNETYE